MNVVGLTWMKVNMNKKERMNQMKKKPLVSLIALMILILMGIIFYQLKEPQPLLPQPDLKVVMVTDSDFLKE